MTTSKLSFALAFFCYQIMILSIAHGQESEKMDQGHQYFTDKDYPNALIAYQAAYDEFLASGQKKDAIASYEFIAKAHMHQYKTDVALDYYYKMASISKKEGWTDVYVNALSSVMAIKSFKTEDDSTRLYASRILRQENIHYSDSSNAYNQIGMVLNRAQKLDSAKIFLRKAEEIDRMHKDSSSLPFVLAGIASVYEKEGDIDEALNFLIESTTWLRPKIDNYKKVSLYRQIAQNFLKIKNTTKAKEYIEESIVLAKEFKTINNVAYSLLTRANILKAEKNYKQALEDYYEVKSILEGTKTKFRLASVSLGICDCHIAMQNYSECESHLKKFEELAVDLESETLDLNYNLIRTEMAMQKNDIAAASEFLERIKNNPTLEDNIFAKLQYEQLLVDYYEATQNPVNALTHLKNAQYLRDSLYTQTQSIAMSEMESKYNKKENELAIATLEFKDQRNQMQIDQQRAILIFGALILFSLMYLIIRIFTQKKQIENQNATISSALKEKELLLREIHHRVKNNLQIISSLLSLQGQYIDDPNVNQAIQEGRNRVKSMSLIHQNLYQKDNLTGVHVKDYMEKLFANLFDSYNIEPDRISLTTEIDEIDLDIDTIIPLGLVINELLTNSLKYAFPDARKGKVKLTIKENEDSLFVSVQDNGIGIENPSKLQENQSFGFELIEAFKHKLKADLEINGSNGTTVALKIKNYKKVA